MDHIAGVYMCVYLSSQDIKIQLTQAFSIQVELFGTIPYKFNVFLDLFWVYPRLMKKNFSSHFRAEHSLAPG